MLAKLFFVATHLRVVWNLYLSMQQFVNPLQGRYWSTTPCLLGSRAVEYSAIPKVDVPNNIPKPPFDDFLREAMVHQLAQGEAVFDFAVQLQIDAVTPPIDDSGLAWSETAPPFRKVTTIRIPQQTLATGAQRNFGGNLSHTPLHSLPGHRPLGGINRVREVV